MPTGSCFPLLLPIWTGKREVLLLPMIAVAWMMMISPECMDKEAFMAMVTRRVRWVTSRRIGYGGKYILCWVCLSDGGGSKWGYGSRSCFVVSKSRKGNMKHIEQMGITNITDVDRGEIVYISSVFTFFLSNTSDFSMGIPFHSSLFIPFCPVPYRTILGNTIPGICVNHPATPCSSWVRCWLESTFFLARQRQQQ